MSSTAVVGMTMRILALLPEAHGARACLNAALAAASVEADATVEAFHVKVDPSKLVRAPEEIAIQHLREADEGSAADRERAVRKVFDDWLLVLDGPERRRVHWREAVGAEDELVMREAGDAALIVLARPQDMDAGDAWHAALIESHRPLLVPSDWSPSGGRPVLAERIAIAWRPYDQARRAVRQAAPWLRQASSVVVLLVAEAGEEVVDTAEIDALMGELGLTYDTYVRPSDHREPGEALLIMVGEMQADALVMGAYRHNEWVEWALGGTTRHVLAHARTPLLMAH